MPRQIKMMMLNDIARSMRMSADERIDDGAWEVVSASVRNEL